MHALDVLKYGNLTVLRALKDLPPDDWQTPGVCGRWSVREIIAHLASSTTAEEYAQMKSESHRPARRR